LTAGADVAVPVAAIQVLLRVIDRSEASTMHGLDEELRRARDELVASASAGALELGGRTSISVTSGCELFLRHATRTFLEFPDFDECKREIRRRGETFATQSRSSRAVIAGLGHPFVRDGGVVFVHGRSRVVVAVLRRAAEAGKRFSVIAADSDGAGAGLRRDLPVGVPVAVVRDAAVGYFMERATLVLVGAEAVVENGGVVNKVGTLVVALCAKANNVPLYVAAESFKFARLFPLKQRELSSGGALGEKTQAEAGAGDDDDVARPPVDYTPPHYIDLLFTDLGVLTPAAVSDELIRLYQ